MKKLLLTLVLSIYAFANTLNINDALPTITFNDQFEKTHTISNDTKMILVAYDKDISASLKEVLLSKNDNYLKDNKIVYVADITGMPYLIAKFFAIPKMKKYPFSVYFLAEENENAFSKKEDMISVYTIKDGKVLNLSHLSSKEEIEKLLK